MQPHDGIYRRLFSHGVLVEDLVRTLLGDKAMAGLRPDTLEPVQAHYVSDELQQREDDAVWRLRHAGDEHGWFYVYVLMEFQSTSDPFMALRIMVYTGLLYQDLAKRKEFDAQGRLPPVLPVVVYNGDPAWSAALDLESLIRDVDSLAAVRPSFRYLLVDEAHHPLHSLPIGSPLRAILELERARQPDDLLGAVRQAVTLVETLKDDNLRRDIETWLRRVLVPARFPSLRGESIGGLKEMETRLERTVRGWTQEWFHDGFTQGESAGLARGRSEGLERGRSEGLERGRSEGLEHGRRQGEAQALLRLLTHRFGELPPGIETRVETADIETLERWLERVLTAECIDDVFR